MMHLMKPDAENHLSFQLHEYNPARASRGSKEAFRVRWARGKMGVKQELNSYNAVH